MKGKSESVISPENPPEVEKDHQQLQKVILRRILQRFGFCILKLISNNSRNGFAKMALLSQLKPKTQALNCTTYFIELHNLIKSQGGVS